MIKQVQKKLNLAVRLTLFYYSGTLKHFYQHTDVGSFNPKSLIWSISPQFDVYTLLKITVNNLT